jgi:hypothetical protein
MTLHELDRNWPRILLAIHYLRCQMLIDRPLILSTLRAWISHGEVVQTHLLQSTLPIIAADTEAAVSMINLVRTLAVSGSAFIRRYGVWFQANYSGTCERRSRSLSSNGSSVHSMRTSFCRGFGVLQAGEAAIRSSTLLCICRGGAAQRPRSFTYHWSYQSDEPESGSLLVKLSQRPPFLRSVVLAL